MASLDSQQRSCAARAFLLFLWSLGAVLFFGSGILTGAHAGTSGFVVRSGSELLLGGSRFRFSGTNAQIATPQNSSQYDRTPSQYYATNFEVTNVLDAAVDMGMTVIRAYSLGNSVGCPNCLEQSPGVINQNTFSYWDYAIQSANQHNLRLIISLVEAHDCPNGDQTGGEKTWETWYGSLGSGCPFYTDPATIAAFERFIGTILNHVNTLTGVAYKNDPTILAWEEDNEGSAPDSWASTIAAYIKSIDTNHMVAWGSNQAGETYPDSTILADSNIDMYSSHEYGGAFGTTEADAVAAAGKVFFVGEYSWDEVTTSQMSTIEGDNSFSGDLTWELIGLADNYGFHPDVSHPATGDNVTQYYPSYSSSYLTNELTLRTHAYTMSGLSVPSHKTLSTAPVITAISATNYISWRGSPTAGSYSVERSVTSGTGGFSVICNQCATDWNTPWQDTTAPSGERWYRVKAFNLSGSASSYSNVWDTSAANPAPPQDINDGNSAWAYSAGWTTATNSDAHEFRNSDYHASSTPGATATLTFTGSQVALFTGCDDASGLMTIAIDGGLPGVIDLYCYMWDTYTWDSSDGERGNYAVYVSPVLASGTHTLVATVLGAQNSVSTGNQIKIDSAEINPLGMTAGSATAPTAGALNVEDSVTGSGLHQWSYSSGWTAVTSYTGYGYSNNDEHYSDVNNATATITFAGTRIQLYGGANNSEGIAGCKIDSGAEVTVDAYLNTYDLGNQLLCDSGALSNGTHTLTVRVTGTKNTNSGGDYVSVDRVLIYPGSTTTVEDSVVGSGSNHWAYSSGWTAITGYVGYDYSNNDEHYSNTTNATATLPFSGSRVQLYMGTNNATGIVGCTIDSGTETLVDAYANFYDLGNQLICDSGTLSSGSHTLKVRVTGTKDANSSDTYIAVDRAVITP